MRRSSLLIATLVGCCLTPVASLAAPSQNAFQREMIQRIAKATGSKVEASGDDWQQLNVDRGGPDKNMFINVGRIWSYCQNASAKECDEAKARFVRALTETPPPARREDLRLIVRDQVYVDYVRSVATADKPYAAAIRQIGDDLYAILAVDSPETIALANPETLTKLGLSEAEAWDIADRQTRAKLPPLPAPDALVKGPTALADYDYLGSLLTQRDVFAKIAAVVGPNLIVTVVSDHFVFVATMPDGPDLEGFAETVRKDCKEQERCISPHIYRFRDGLWRIAEKGGR